MKRYDEGAQKFYCVLRPVDVRDFLNNGRYLLTTMRKLVEMLIKTGQAYNDEGETP